MPASRLLSSLCALLLAGLLAPALHAQQAPAVRLGKEEPTSVAELRALEALVQKALDKVVPCTVGIRIGNAQGSGVIVSADGYVLTAGHVSGDPNRDVFVTLPSGKELKARTLGRNIGIDSGLLKIVDPGPHPFVARGKSSTLVKGQWVIAVGHPGGFRANRTPVVRVGRVLFVNPFVIRTDCTLVGGDSGGPLFDLDGNVVGIHSRIGSSSITENLHVPIDTYNDTWDRLAAAESWGGRLGQQPTVQSAGGKIVFEKQDSLTGDDFIDKARGGHHYKSYTLPLKAGSTYTFDLSSRRKGGFDAFLILEDGSGKKLAEDDDGAGSNDARIVHRATRDGDYRVVVSSFEPGQTGAFRLTVREADFRDPLVAGRVDVLKALGLPRQIATVILQKLAEKQVRLHLSAAVQDDSGKPAADQAALVRWDGGELKVKADSKGVVRLVLSRAKLKGLTLELPGRSKALLSLTDALGNPMGPRFGPNNDPARATVKSAGGTIVMEATGTLSASDPRDTEKTKSYRKAHEIKLAPGAAYTIDLESEDFDAFVRLEDAAGKKLAEDDDGAGYLNSRIVFRTSQEGAFRIVVTTFDGDQTGDYRLTVRRAEEQVK